MSETLAGWAQTITLCEGVEAVVAARRGATAQLRFPDDETKALPLTSLLVDSFALQLRGCFGGGAATSCTVDAFGRLSFAVERERGEPLIALMRAAVNFSEGTY